MNTQRVTSFEIDFPKQSAEDMQLHVSECWQLADGSLVYKVEGKTIVQLPQFSVLGAEIT